MSGYRPEASAVSDGAMAAWLAEALLAESVTSVPGVGPKTAEALAKVGVHTPHQLMGKFLCLRSPGLGCKPLCDAFYAWLKDSGVNANRRCGELRYSASVSLRLSRPAAAASPQLH
jgi:hypothetical protein